MFRDIMIVALIGLGFGLAVSNPDDWKWVGACGPQVVAGVNYLVMARPFSTIICFALAVALFMTRLKY